jgi:dihydrofolate reductase
MTTVVAEISMSQDGFLVDHATGPDQVLEWCEGGGAIVVGRRTFDAADWTAVRSARIPVFVVTHSSPAKDRYDDGAFTFVTDGGVKAAVARAKMLAGAMVVGLAGANLTWQAVNAGLVDDLRVTVVPVVMGKGIRIDETTHVPVRVEGPRGVEGTGVTHVSYRGASAA